MINATLGFFSGSVSLIAMTIEIWSKSIALSEG